MTAKAPALTGYAENLAAQPGVAFSNVAVAEFIDPNQADTSGSFTATINWGDNTSSTGTVSGSGGVFEVKGGHTYADSGSFGVDVIVWLNQKPVEIIAVKAEVLPNPRLSATLADVLRANFNAWSNSTNANGVAILTLKRVQQLLDDPTIRGADAAALATLYNFVMFNGGDPAHPEYRAANARLFVANPAQWDPNKDGITLDDIKYYDSKYTTINPGAVPPAALIMRPF